MSIVPPETAARSRMPSWPSPDAADPARSLVTVRARVRNTSRETLTGLGARLVVQRSATAAREALAHLTDSLTEPSGVPLG